ncbi:hypothetical protein WA026_001681, partial [Henosepilachna vigintioctopunctata]
MTVEKSIHENPKYFWKYFNVLKQDKGLPKEMRLEDVRSSDDSEIADLFKNNFSGVFKTSSPRDVSSNYKHKLD